MDIDILKDTKTSTRRIDTHYEKSIDGVIIPPTHNSPIVCRVSFTVCHACHTANSDDPYAPIHCEDESGPLIVNESYGREARDYLLQVLCNLGVEKQVSREYVLDVFEKKQRVLANLLGHLPKRYKYLLEVDFVIVQYHERVEDHESWQGRPTAKSILDELERVDIKQNCLVCLEGLVKEDKELLVRLPCKHVFHEGCVLEWLRTSNVCPICRFEFAMESL